jgi:hypothetical protein
MKEEKRNELTMHENKTRDTEIKQANPRLKTVYR